MPARPAPRLALLGVLTLVGACVVLPSPSPSPSPTPNATRSPTQGPEPTPLPTPEPPLSLQLPDERDDRQIRFSIDSDVPAQVEGEGRIVVSVTSLADSTIDELVLRWPIELREQLFLSPVDPRPLGPQNLLVVPWTKWVDGPGERGEPAGTTSLGWGPLEAGATINVTLYVTRRASGAVEFDLQFLAEEAILTTEDGQPAEVRVRIE